MSASSNRSFMARISALFSFSRVYFAWISVLVFIAFDPPPFFQAFDLKIYDQLMRYTAPDKPDRRITIIGVDQKSLDTFGRWPWSRDVIGKLVEKASAFGARVVTLDMTFSTQTDSGITQMFDKLERDLAYEWGNYGKSGFHDRFRSLRKNISRDEALANSIKKAGNVVTGILFQDTPGPSISSEAEEKTIEPFRIKGVSNWPRGSHGVIKTKAYGVDANIPIIQQAGVSTGFMNTWTDHDGSIRKHPIVFEYKGKYYPSLDLSAVMVYTNTVNSAIISFDTGALQAVVLDGTDLPADQYGRMFIRYMPDKSFPVVSAADVVTEPLASVRMQKALGGKIALVGSTATSVYDMRVTPFGSTAGVEIHANVISTLLNNNAIAKFDWQRFYDMFMVLALGVGLWYALPRLSVFKGVALFAFLLAGLGWFNYYNFAVNSVWLNSVTPLLTIITGFIGMTTSQFITERKSKKFIQGAFSRYLSPAVIHQIIENPSLLNLGGEKRVMTAFFSDVAGFTSISEKLEPDGLVALLNDYLSLLTDIIYDLDGTVDKFEGDAIIAFWGAPIHIENHAELCVRASAQMQRTIAENRPRWLKEWNAELNTRMGVNTGSMVVGNMGSRDRMDYTMMGDPVNLAARLESANKYYGSKTLVSQFTYELIKDKFLFREVDLARVAGKKIAIRLYEMIDEIEHATPEQKRHTALFEEGLGTFRDRQFEEAMRRFEQCLTLDGAEDKASRLYIQRCAQLIETPPPDDWDTAFDLAK